ncbi:MAG: DUF3467 domain-containing protein [Odoribacteraceae bacterium]|nr:DUF3467 domain-containing protein [Odoribacteraceae bacterium]
MEGNKEQMDVELSHEIAQGTYSNLAIISHSNSEFIIDFVRIMPGIPKASVKSRIILTPEHAKRLMLALQENISKFEQHNGRIILRDKAPDDPFPDVIEPRGQA